MLTIVTFILSLLGLLLMMTLKKLQELYNLRQTQGLSVHIWRWEDVLKSIVPMLKMSEACMQRGWRFIPRLHYPIRKCMGDLIKMQKDKLDKAMKALIEDPVMLLERQAGNAIKIVRKDWKKKSYI